MATTETVDLKARFVEALEHRDWYAQMSDDYSVYSKGETQRMALTMLREDMLAEFGEDETFRIWNEHCPGRFRLGTHRG